jgi:hypothetical protein
MKHALCILAAIMSFAHAGPVISTLDWRPACDGASIEVISDHKKVLSIRASAFHAAIIAEWAVHYFEGKPVSAEYRELNRGRIQEGDRAGEYSGENSVKEIHSWIWIGDGFPIKDEERAKELADILAKAKTQAEQAVSSNRR